MNNDLVRSLIFILAISISFTNVCSSNIYLTACKYIYSIIFVLDLDVYVYLFILIYTYVLDLDVYISSFMFIRL